MATDININDLTTGTLTGTGTFDKLMKVVNLHIEDQYNKGRITGPDYANVYLGSIQSVIAQSMQFLLQEKQAEAAADSTKATTAYDIAISLATLQKEYGFGNAVEVDNVVTLGASTDNGKIDETIRLLVAQEKQTNRRAV